MTSARALSIVRKFFPSVDSVVDARKSVVLGVTKRDIAIGTTRQHKSCALAQACKRRFRLTGALISISRAYFIRGHRAVRYEVADNVGREIVSFDRGGRFSPGTYTLRKITKAHRQNSKKRGGGQHTGTRPAPRHITANIRASLSA